MDTEDWVLKGLMLMTNTKKQRLKILSRGSIPKNTILKKNEKKSKKEKNKKRQTNQPTNKVTKIIKYVYMKFVLKIGSFFLQGNGYRNEN